MTEPAKQELTPLQKAVLSRIPYGKENAISQKDLAKACGITLRRTTDVVRELILLHYQVTSSKSGKNHGYYKVVTKEEALHAMNTYKRKIEDASPFYKAYAESIRLDGAGFTDNPTYDSNHAKQLNLNF